MTARRALRALVVVVLGVAAWTVADELILMTWSACALGAAGVLAAYDRAVSVGTAS